MRRAASPPKAWSGRGRDGGGVAKSWTMGRCPRGLIEGYHTKIKPLKPLGYGFRHRDRYRRKMFLGLPPLIALPQ